MSAKLLNSYANSAPYLVGYIKDFLVTDVGWGLVQTIEESAETKDYVLSSEYATPTSSGTTVTGTFCIRLFGYSGFVDVYGYDSCYTTETGTFFSGEIYDLTYSKIKCPASEFQYWAIADSDCVKIVIGSEDQTEFYHGYIGLIESVYYGDNDEVPLLVFGTSTETSSWVDNHSTVMSTASGGVYPYSVWNTYSAEFGESERIGFCGGLSPTLYLKSPTDQQEVRGLPKGVYKIPDSCGGYGMQYTIGSGTYYAFSKMGTQTEAYMYGPVYI